MHPFNRVMRRILQERTVDRQARPWALRRMASSKALRRVASSTRLGGPRVQPSAAPSACEAAEKPADDHEAKRSTTSTAAWTVEELEEG